MNILKSLFPIFFQENEEDYELEPDRVEVKQVFQFPSSQDEIIIPKTKLPIDLSYSFICDIEQMVKWYDRYKERKEQREQRSPIKWKVYARLENEIKISQENDFKAMLSK